MSISHPMVLMMEYFIATDHARPNGNGERFSEMELALLQARSRPNALVAWWRARKLEQLRAATFAQLSQLPPHLLDDVGMKPTAEGGFEPIKETAVPDNSDKFMPMTAGRQIPDTPPLRLEQTARAA